MELNGWTMTSARGKSWSNRDGRKSDDPTPWSDKLKRYLTPDEAQEKKWN